MRRSGAPGHSAPHHRPLSHRDVAAQSSGVRQNDMVFDDAIVRDVGVGL